VDNDGEEAEEEDEEDDESESDDEIEEIADGDFRLDLHLCCISSSSACHACNHGTQHIGPY
jgi:hypothetical protein